MNEIHLMGLLKQSLVENISLQRCNCKSDFLRFRVFFRASSLKNEVGDPPFFFTLLTSLTHHLSTVKFAEKNQC